MSYLSFFRWGFRNGPSALCTEFPEAPALLERAGKYFQWLIRSCPICKGMHHHGGGRVGDDPRRLLGHRVKHCLGRLGPPHGYILTDQDPEGTRRMLHEIAGQ